MVFFYISVKKITYYTEISKGFYQIFLLLSNKYFLAATHHGEAGGGAREGEDGELVGRVAGSPPPRILFARAEVEGAEHLTARKPLS